MASGFENRRADRHFVSPRMVAGRRTAKAVLDIHPYGRKSVRRRKSKNGQPFTGLTRFSTGHPLDTVGVPGDDATTVINRIVRIIAKNIRNLALAA